MTPGAHLIIRDDREINRAGSLTLIPDKLRQGVKNETDTPPGWENIPTGDEIFKGALTVEELEELIEGKTQ